MSPSSRMVIQGGGINREELLGYIIRVWLREKERDIFLHILKVTRMRFIF